MKSRSGPHLLVPLLAAMTLATPLHAAPNCSAYAGDLAAMVEAADAARGRVDYLAPGDDPVAAGNREALNVIERANAERLGAWLQSCGWPRQSVEGPQAARSAWLVAQQRAEDIPFQRLVVRQLELAVLDGEAPAMHLAAASDRLAVREGRLQRYGTQLRQVDACQWDYYPLEETERVEARRRRLGLPPLDEHKRGINDTVATKNCQGARSVAAVPAR